MSPEEFKELKSLCDANDFELLNLNHEDNEKYYVVAKKKNPWEGVEFVECLQNLSADDRPRVQKGQICLITEVSGDAFYISQNSKYPWNKNLFKPSTESAYVEQLRKEAIKRGIISICNLDISMMHGGELEDKSTEFKYRKDTDTFYWFGCPIYQQGKWAKVKPKRIEVKCIDHDYEQGNYFADKFALRFQSKNLGERDYDEIGQFLSKQLEKFLNGEIGKEDSNG